MIVLAYDLDGTLIDSKGKPLQGEIDNLNAAFENPQNFIVIHTSRSYSIFHETRALLFSLGIKHHALVMEKMRATEYIDDKARRPI